MIMVAQIVQYNYTESQRGVAYVDIHIQDGRFVDSLGLRRQDDAFTVADSCLTSL